MKPILTYRLKVKHDQGTKTIITAASSEQAAREIVCKAEGCPDSAIIQVRHHDQEWSELTPAQRTAAALLAYYCFHYYKQTNESNYAKMQAAEHACSLFEVPYIVKNTIKAGYIKGLPNLGRISGGNYNEDYKFDTEI